MSGAPVIPTALQVYNSYVEDPKWQRKFTVVWGVALAVAVLASLPSLARAFRARRALTGLFGVWEDLSAKRYATPKGQEKQPPQSRKSRIEGLLGTFRSCMLWSLPGTELDLGQMLVIVGYLITVLICMTNNVELVTYPNRGGFIALAQFPVVFLFATKNSLVSLLLGPGSGYEKLNYIHRWSGRGLFIAATVHGALWIRNHLIYALPIIGPQKETSGVGAFGALCCVVLFSFRPFRRFWYQGFFVVHVLTFVAFYITVCYHTIYAAPWIYPPLALYGLDFAMRLLRYRIKPATLVAAADQMTIINVHDCDGGWVAGQHVRLRVIFGGRLFESHPLTILSAPREISCLSPGGMILGARAVGGWSRSLNALANSERERLLLAHPKMRDADGVGADVHVVVDGPYGGCSVDLGQYESALLVAGGSGATFTLGLLDDIVGRCVKLGRRGGERTKRIEFAWCIRSFGALDWFSRYLMEIAEVAATSSSLDLHISIFVTCLCNPEAVPPIPNSDVVVERPSVQKMLNAFVSPPVPVECDEKVGSSLDGGPDACCCSKPGDVEEVEEGVATGRIGDPKARTGLKWVGLGGGVAVCASGPERLARAAHNAVARLGMTKSMELGGIELHTEVFSL